MKCNKCNKQSEISFKHIGNLCNNCFINLVEKRVKKELRKKWEFKKNQKVLIIDDNTKEGQVNACIAQSIIKKLPLIVEIKKDIDINKEINNYDIIFVSWCLDKEIELFLNSLFQNGDKYIDKGDIKIIKLLKNISDEEIEIMAKIKNLEFQEKEKSELNKFINNIEKKYPGSKFALLKSKEIID